MKAPSPARDPRPVNAPVNAMTVDVEDWFQVQAFAGTIDRADWDTLERRVEANTTRILDMFAAAGVTGTFFTLGWVAERHPALVRRIVADGHELASHTFGHSSCRSVSCEEFCEDVKKGSEAVEDLSGMPSGNFAYPFGHVTLPAKRALAASLASARGVFPGCNGPEVDLNLLRANSLYGDLDGAREIEELIAENVQRNSWLIFYTHDVQAKPSAFGCTPALFEAAVSHAACSGCRILTVQEALEESGVQNGNPKGHVRERASV